jgi:hypothetical protein
MNFYVAFAQEVRALITYLEVNFVND